MVATIALPDALRERIERFGAPGMTFAEILNALMDRVEREDFVRDLRRQYANLPRRAYVDLEDL